MMRRLLVTGGAGFIGGNFVHYMRNASPSGFIVVLDALTYAGRFETIAPLVDNDRVHFVHGDIADGALVERLINAHELNTIVHFAAESHVDRSIESPAQFVRTNVLGTQVLLDVARSAWSHRNGWREGVRFHHISTDEVFGSLEPHDHPFTEQSPYRPSSPYAASKAASDHLVRAFAHTYGMPVTITNCSNNYGPYQFPEKLIPLMIVNALLGRALPVYGDGMQVRDWLHVHDHCAAIERVLANGTVGVTYNIGGNAGHPNLFIVRRLCEIIDSVFAADPSLSERFPACPASNGESVSTLISHVRDRPGHDRRYAIDASLIARDLGFRPSHDLASGLKSTVAWYLANENWWRGCIDPS